MILILLIITSSSLLHRLQRLLVQDLTHRSMFNPRKILSIQYSWQGECQAFDPDPSGIKDPLLCKEIFSSCGPLGDGLDSMNNINGGAYNGPYGISVLENLELDTQPDFSACRFTIWFARQRVWLAGPIMKVGEEMESKFCWCPRT
ncbi:hypothetical protein Ancab_002731 [Ancistrocladus abbreviatus]